MPKKLVLNDELLEKLGSYYSHRFVQRNMPWLVEMGFEAFLNRELLRLQERTMSKEKTLSPVEKV
ncbi:hypothetical protein [Aneurinibacillus terranovensis]|uniref:hypothetical protein n=1 Tax=Aneurinibacillus terranovensis TaxID=278991 RepID=UPI000422F7E4|nr:hypothetical protein [Aneurinibacillus terranovensis]